MNYVIIKTGGKQYKASKGDILDLELPANTGQSKDMVFDKVILYVDNDEVKIGTPLLQNISVKAKLLENFKSKKIAVAKFRAKSRYRRITGHRSMLSRMQIEGIVMKKSQ